MYNTTQNWFHGERGKSEGRGKSGGRAEWWEGEEWGRGKFCLVLHIYVFSVKALFSYPVLYYNERGTNT